MADIVQEKRLTAEDYFATYPETMQRMELIDGEVITMPAPHDLHQALSLKIVLQLSKVIVEKQFGELRYAPTDVVFEATVVTQPDIFFVSNENQDCMLQDGRWYGAPDLCVEVLSPGTARLDRGYKFDLYQQHGVREYWIVDPDQQMIEVYQWQEGHYIRHGYYTGEDSLTSSVLPDLKLALQDLFPPAENQPEPPSAEG